MRSANGRDEHPPAAAFLKAAALLAWLLAIAYSLSPFEAGAPLEGALHGAALAERPTADYLLSLVLHLLAFVSVGALDRSSSGRVPGAPRSNRLTTPALIRGLLLCAAIEGAQFFAPDRHAELLDLAANASGLLFGHVVGRRLLTSHIADGRRWPRWTHLRRAALAAWVVTWSTAMLLPAWLVKLDTWDRSYPVVIGDELTGGRPWAGEVRSVAFYDRALTSAEAVRLDGLPPRTMAGADARAGSGLLAGFDFTEANRRHVTPAGRLNDSSLELALPPDARWLSAPPAALRLDGGTIVRSAGAANSLTARLASTGAFSVEAWVRPASGAQTGPARIVTISRSPYRRNVTLGQEGTSLQFRVRNRLNGVNGDGHALACDVFTERWIHVLAIYDRGVSRLVVDGRQACRSMNLREPSVALGLGTGPVSHAMTAMLAALSLVVVSGGTSSLRWLLLVGYAPLLAVWGLARLSGIHLASSLYLGLPPAIVVSCLALSRLSPTALLRRNPSHGG
jgi:VanZ family protein